MAVKAKVKTDLVAFQNRLSEQLDDLHSKRRVESWMAFSAAQANWLVEIGDAREIAVYPDSVFRFDLVRPWMLGIGNFRGMVHSLVDFSLFLGGAPTQVNANTRAVIVHQKFDTNVALIVPSVFGIRRKDTLVSRPGAAKSSVWSKEVFEDKDGMKWEFLDVQGLVSSREMMDIEA